MRSIASVASRPLTARLAAGDRWDLVFNYAEGMFGFAREAQVPALLDAFQIPVHLLRRARLRADAPQGAHQARRARPRTADARLRRGVIGRRGRARPAAVPAVREARRVRIERRHLRGVVRRRAGGAGSGVRANASRSTASRRSSRHSCPAASSRSASAARAARARVLGVMEVVFTADAEAHGYSYANKKLVHARYRIVDDAAAAGAADIALRRVDRPRLPRPRTRGLPLRCDGASAVPRSESARRSPPGPG